MKTKTFTEWIANATKDVQNLNDIGQKLCYAEYRKRERERFEKNEGFIHSMLGYSK